MKQFYTKLKTLVFKTQHTLTPICGEYLFWSPKGEKQCVVIGQEIVVYVFRT